MARARIHDVAAVAALLALAVAAAALALSWQSQRTVTAAAERADDRYERRLADGVVYRVAREGPLPGTPGEKPQVGASADVVVNHGPYAVEDVELQGEVAGEDDPIPGLVEVLPIGTVEPCTAVAVDRGDHVRVVFTDAEGRRWSRALQSAPERYVAPEDVLEARPDISQARDIRLFPVLSCGGDLPTSEQGDDG